MYEGRKCGRKIQKLMDEQGLTCSSLGDKLGLTETAVARYVNGRVPSAAMLMSIAMVLHTTIDFLLDDTKESQ